MLISPLDKPTKITLFDVDYVVVRRSGGREPIAMLDKCPHRGAALSEGRLTVNNADIVLTDIDASNGVIHVIDGVLIPN